MAEENVKGALFSFQIPGWNSRSYNSYTIPSVLSCTIYNPSLYDTIPSLYLYNTISSCTIEHTSFTMLWRQQNDMFVDSNTSTLRSRCYNYVFMRHLPPELLTRLTRVENDGMSIAELPRHPHLSNINQTGEEPAVCMQMKETPLCRYSGVHCSDVIQWCPLYYVKPTPGYYWDMATSTIWLSGRVFVCHSEVLRSIPASVCRVFLALPPPQKMCGWRTNLTLLRTWERWYYYSLVWWHVLPVGWCTYGSQVCTSSGEALGANSVKGAGRKKNGKGHCEKTATCESTVAHILYLFILSYTVVFASWTESLTFDRRVELSAEKIGYLVDNTNSSVSGGGKI